MAEIKTDTLSLEALSAKYSVAASMLKENPDLLQALYKILGFDSTGTTKISAEIVDPTLQLAIVQSTNWFKNNTDDFRKFDFYKRNNPATYKADLQKNAQALIKTFFQSGIKLDPDKAITLAEQAMMKSAVVNGNTVIYDQDYFKKIMADSIDFSKKRTLPNGKVVYDLDGKLEAVADSLYKTAWDYGFPATVSNKAFDSWMQRNVRGLVSGEINPEDVDNELQSQAKSMFPGLTDQLNRGLSLREAADPWITAISNELEQDARFFDVNDNVLYKALNYQDEKGNIAPMNLYQAKTLARKDSRWQYTEKAKQEYTNIGQKILQDFGFLG